MTEALTATLRDSDWHAPESHAARIERGRHLRASVPRSALGSVSRDPRDPNTILDAQNRGRVAELIPVRAARMSESPFAFYRGTAALMAADFAREPHSGIIVPSCGDAHIANFGFYASPQRTLVFDLNDFDEAAWAPWEWDLKRLVASVVIAGQASSRDQTVTETAVLSAVRAYARALRHATEMSPRDRHAAHFDAESARWGLSEASASVLRRATKHARKRTVERAARKLTRAEPSGRLRFVAHPPTMVPASEDVSA